MAETTSDSGGFLSWYFKSNLMMRILFGLALGAIVGIVLGYSPDAGKAFIEHGGKFLGDLFVRLLKMIVVPVMFFSLISGASSISPKQIGKVGAKVVAWYLLTSIVAAGIGVVIASMFSPGEGLNIVGNAKAAENKVSMCIGCHGIPGYKASYPEVYQVPMLGGQSARYIENALRAYQKGERKHPSMMGVAASLSDQDIADLAAYYSQQK